MVYDIAVILGNVFTNVISWFDTVMNQTQSLSTWLLGVLMVVVLRLLLQPFIGRAIHRGGSDRVTKRDRQGGDNR